MDWNYFRFTGERVLMLYCCGKQGKIWVHRNNFLVDNYVVATFAEVPVSFDHQTVWGSRHAYVNRVRGKTWGDDTIHFFILKKNGISNAC